MAATKSAKKSPSKKVARKTKTTKSPAPKTARAPKTKKA